MIAVVLVSTSAISSGGMSAASATPTGRQPFVPPQISWLAMGDSYSAGEGSSGAGNSRWPGSRDQDGTCQRSDQAWAPTAYRQLRAAKAVDVTSFDFVACTGAVISGSGNDLNAQLHEAGIDGDGPARYDLITFSFGGNDLGFTDIVTECLGSLAGNFKKTYPWVVPPGCTETDQQLQQRLDHAATDLAILFRAIEPKVKPGGHVVVLGYPLGLADPGAWPYVTARGFPPSRPQACNGIGAADAARLRSVGVRLDREIANAASAYPNVGFVDVATGFEPHDLCGTGEPWINGFPTVEDLTGTSKFPPGSCPSGKIEINHKPLPSTICRTSRTFHPNDAGQRYMASLVTQLIPTLDWSRLGTTITPTPNPTPNPPLGAGTCAADADILAAARTVDPALAEFASVSDKTCAGDEVAAWIDQSANGLAVLLRRQSGTLTAIVIGENICANPDVTTSPPAIHAFLDC